MFRWITVQVKTLLRKVYDWLRVADAPVMRQPVDPALVCDLCEERAVLFISSRWMLGDVSNSKYCQQHRPNLMDVRQKAADVEG